MSYLQNISGDVNMPDDDDPFNVSDYEDESEDESSDDEMKDQESDIEKALFVSNVAGSSKRAGSSKVTSSAKKSKKSDFWSNPEHEALYYGCSFGLRASTIIKHVVLAHILRNRSCKAIEQQISIIKKLKRWDAIEKGLEVVEEPVVVVEGGAYLRHPENKDDAVHDDEEPAGDVIPPQPNLSDLIQNGFYSLDNKLDLRLGSMEQLFGEKFESMESKVEQLESTVVTTNKNVDTRLGNIEFLQGKANRSNTEVATKLNEMQRQLKRH